MEHVSTLEPKWMFSDRFAKIFKQRQQERIEQKYLEMIQRFQRNASRVGRSATQHDKELK